MNGKRVMGIDLGGTNARAGIIDNDELGEVSSVRIHSDGTVGDVMSDLFGLVDKSIDSSVEAIGIGVPSVVDVDEGIVYDVQNIPSWKEVHLRELMEDRYNLPVLVNNDANCFALGEKYFGKGRGAHSMIGLIIGTGMGAGLVVNDHLYAGPNCGAGEFGMVDYLDQNYEYYASGQFFEQVHLTAGEKVFKSASQGDQTALEIFEELGVHIGNAIKMILYTFDPELVILGGSVSQAYTYFEKSMWRRIRTFAYSKSLEKFRIEVSELENCGVLGAAALYYDSKRDI